MHATGKPLLALTASDLMTTDIVRLLEEMPLREAARLLLQNQVGGAPVVDAQGRCVGVLSATDFLRLAGKRDALTQPAAGPLPITCGFQAKHRTPDGREVTLCTLPPGVCPIQVRQSEPGGEDLLLCGQPHCVLADWQVVQVENLPADAVRSFMTADPVTATAEVPIRTLARRMIDAHIHRVIVVDEQGRPIGVVSSTDVLAAVAYAESGE